MYPFLLPLDLLAIPFGLLIALVFGGKVSAYNGVVLIVLKRDSRVGQYFKHWGAWTFGHMIVTFDDQDMAVTVVRHEGTHVKQLEMAGIQGALLAAMVVYWLPWAALAIWALCPILAYVAGYAVAISYGGNAYRDNPDEVAAYDHAGEQKL